MSFNWNNDIYGNNPAFDTGGNQATPRTPGYNDPWYDPQRQGQYGGDPNALGSFQPTPASPQPPNYTDGTNWNNVFGSQPYGNQGGADIWQGMQPNNGIGGGYNFNQPTGGTFTDEFGNQQSNTAISSMNGGQSFGDPSSRLGLTGSITPTTATMPQQQGQGQGQGQQGANPDAAFPKYDPAYLAQIQAATEDPNGPYANRKPGDYGPIGAPDYVLNPQGDEQWQQRFYWLAANPTAFTTGYTQPRDMSAQQYDYSKPNSVPYTAFLNNAYADTNAKQGFKELSGVLTADQLKQTQQQYGWQDAVSGFNANPNQVYQRMDQEARANPGVDYEVVRVAQPDGSVAYGLQKREQSQQAQQARGFNAPSNLPPPRTSGGGNTVRYNNGNNGGGNKSAASLPVPQGTTHIQPGTPLDTRMTGGSVNMGKPVEGQIINYNGQNVQYRQGRWVPLSYSGGSQRHPSPV